MILRTQLSRDSWAPVDTAKVHPDVLADLYASPEQPERPFDYSPISVKLGGMETSFWVLPDAAIPPGCLQIPLWPAMIFNLKEESCVEVRRPSPSRRRIKEVRGPYVAAAEDAMVPFIVLGMSSLREAISRQLSRSPLQVQGMMLALRLSGYVCTFQVSEVSEPLAADSLEAGDLTIKQHLLSSHNAGSEERQCLREEAAQKCLAAVSLKGGAPSLALPQPPQPVLFEGGPPACELQAFVQVLERLWISQGGQSVIQLPLVDMCWQLLQQGGSPVTFGKYIFNFLANLLPGWRQRVGGEGGDLGQPCGDCLVFLGCLDGPLPVYGKQLDDFQSNLWPLRALKWNAAVLGVCSSKADVHPLLRDYFLNADAGQSGPLQDLGLQTHSDKQSKASFQASSGSVEVIGCKDILHELEATVVQYFRNLELFHGMGIAWPPRTLLHGPPGSGKSHLLRWLASQVELLGVRISWLRPSNVLSRYLGESEERLRLAFAAASGGPQGSLLLVEGLDEFVRKPAGDNTGFHNRMAATFLTLLDGIDSPVSVSAASKEVSGQRGICGFAY